jgi:porin
MIMSCVKSKSIMYLSAYIAAALASAAFAPALVRAEPVSEDTRPYLAVEASYTADGFWNASGGLEQQGTYLDLVEISADFDLGRALQSRDLLAHLSLIHTNGTELTKHVGDAMVVSNIEAVDHPTVFEAWLDWGMDTAGRWSLRTGFYDLNSEFDTTESRGLFLNSAYGIGQEIAQTGEYGPSIYPVTSLGARIAWQPRDPWAIRLAVLDAVPGESDDIEGSRWHLSKSEGALCVMEVATALGAFSQVSVGHWRYTAEFTELLAGPSQTEPASSNDNSGTYVTAEFGPRRPASGNGLDWSGFVRAGTANERINVFARHVAAGINLAAPWPRKSGSQLGLAAAEARLGDDYRTLRRSEGNPAAPFERNVELTWRIPLGEHVMLQPDLQFVVNPGGERNIPDAWVVGLRVELRASGSRQ